MGFFGCMICSLFKISLFGFEIGVGYIYPLIKTLEMICKNAKEIQTENLKKWLTYWLTLALISAFIFPIFSFFTGKISILFQIIKVGMFGYLVLTDKATKIIYEKLFRDEHGIVDAILDQFQAYCQIIAKKFGILKQKEEEKKNE